MKELWIYHTIALTASFFLDRLVGDPYSLPHPVRWIGSLIGFLDKKLRIKTETEGFPKQEISSERNFRRGLLLVIIVLLIVSLITGTLIFLAYKIHPFLGIGIEIILSCYFLAAKNLRDESMKVYKSLKDRDLEGARKNLSMIVGRDTDNLYEERIAKAAVETVAENASDGVIAPFLYMIAGGPILGAFYKAINTMDSMLGYRNEKYEHFGKVAARLDDAANFLPSRFSALLMIAASYFLGLYSMDYSSRQALSIWKRDRLAHKSPNSAQTESVAAGALGLALGGSSTYGSKLVEKPVIGEELKKTDAEDIRKMNRLMYMTEDLLLAGFLIISLVIIILS